MPMSILEPPRMPLGQAFISKDTNAKCCRCCMDYGTTSVSMTSDKNFVVNGDSISVKCTIDNTKGEEDIKSHRVILKQCRVMISSRGVAKYFEDR